MRHIYIYIKNNTCYLLFFCLVILLPIDGLYYTLEIYYGLIRIPFGIIGGIIGISLGLLLLNIEDRTTLIVCTIILIFIFSGIIACYSSPYSDELWIKQFLWYISYFSIGYALCQTAARKDMRVTKLFCIIVTVCAMVTAALIRYNWIESDFNYLRPGVAFFLSGAIAISFARTVSANIIIYLSVLVCLILLNGRTWLYLWMVYPVLLSASSIFVNRERPASGHMAQAVIGVVSAVLLLGFPAIPRSLFGSDVINSRIAFNVDHAEETLMGRFSDPNSSRPTLDDMTSLGNRLTFLMNGLSEIREHPIFGYYNGYIHMSGQGGYIHNILSYWQQYGIIPFICILTLLCISLVIIFMWRKGSKDNIDPLIPSVFLSLLGASILTRSYTAAELFFAIGLVIGRNASLRRQNMLSGK